MRSKLLIILMTVLGLNISAQVKPAEPVDTVYNPNIIYTGIPNKYEIAGIKVTGVPNYEDYIIIGYSGINIGDRIEIPGPELTAAAKRFARQGLFSSIQIKVEKRPVIWLGSNLRSNRNRASPKSTTSVRPTANARISKNAFS